MNSREEHAPSVESSPWSVEFDAILEDQRRRARQRRDERRGAMEQLSRTLQERMARLDDELSRHRENIEQENATLAQRREEMEEQRRELTELKDDLQQRRAEWERLQTEAARRHEDVLKQLAAQVGELHTARAALEQSRGAAGPHVADAAHLELQSERLQNLERELAVRGERLSHQRRHVASQLRARRAEVLAEIERRRAELEQFTAGGDGQLQARAAEAASQCERLREEAARSEQAFQERQEEWEAERIALQRQVESIDRREKELAEQRRRLAREIRAQREKLRADYQEQRADFEKEALERQAQLQVDLADARAHQERLRDDASHANQRAERLERELKELRENSERRHREGLERLQREMEQLKSEAARRAEELRAQAQEAHRRAEDLRKQLDESEAKLQEARNELEEVRQSPSSSAPPADNEEFEHLQRRFEMAVQEVRELKSKNAELEKQLEKGRKAPAPAKGAPGKAPAAPRSDNADGLDWAAQKARLLAQLESDFDESEKPLAPEEQAARMAIEEVIERTDEIIAAKDREIAELQRMLDQQSATLGEVAVGAHAFAQILDQDEIVRQERESLKKLEAEWREKVRQAEIDISVERAKLARERTKLEEENQRMQSERKLDLGPSTPEGKKSGRNRWLTRLGLTDDDEAT